MVIFLETVGHIVNRKRVQRLMQQMGLAGMAAVVPVVWTVTGEE